MSQERQPSLGDMNQQRLQARFGGEFLLNVLKPISRNMLASLANTKILSGNIACRSGRNCQRNNKVVGTMRPMELCGPKNMQLM